MSLTYQPTSLHPNGAPSTHYQTRMARRDADSPFAAFIRERRQALDLSLRGLSTASGIPHSRLYEFERGAPCMRVDTLATLARGLGVEPLKLIALVLDESVDHVSPSHEAPPPAATLTLVTSSPLLQEAQRLQLNALRDYGHPNRWLVWVPGQEDSIVETSVDHCACERFHKTGACPCVALVRQLEATRKDRAA